jgi:hypothetical protein
MIQIKCFLSPSQNQTRKLTFRRSCANCTCTSTPRSLDTFSLKKKEVNFVIFSNTATPITFPLRDQRIKYVPKFYAD